MDACWYCGTSKSGVEDPTFRKADELHVARDKWGQDTDGSMPTCPNCKSSQIIADSPSPWIVAFALMLFPFGLLLLLLNSNVWCGDCGVRFKKVQKLLAEN